MKKPNFIIVLACLVLIAGVLSFSQEGKADRATVSFSDPSKPGFIELSVHRGSITVKGYNGKEVIIEARAVTRKLKDRNEEAILREFARTARTRARAEVTDRQGEVLRGKATVYDEAQRPVMEFYSTFKIAKDATIRGISFRPP